MHDAANAARTFKDIVRDNSEREALQRFQKLSKMPPRAARHLDEVVKRRAEPLGLPAWYEAFPEFPMLLDVRPSSKLKEFARLDAFFSSKRRQTLIKEFLAAVDARCELAYARITVVLLKLPYVDDWMAAHNGGGRSHVLSVQLRIPIDDTAYLTVEPLDSFIHSFEDFLKSYYATFA